MTDRLRRRSPRTEVPAYVSGDSHITVVKVLPPETSGQAETITVSIKG